MGGDISCHHLLCSCAVYRCTSGCADNYDPDANTDNGSCEYPSGASFLFSGYLRMRKECIMYSVYIGVPLSTPRSPELDHKATNQDNQSAIFK